jgi:hypothetical protein
VGRDLADIDLIWVKRKPIYFCGKDWTTRINLIRLNKSRFARIGERCST